MEPDERDMMEARLAAYRAKLHEIHDLAEEPDQVSPEDTLLRVAEIAEAALQL